MVEPGPRQRATYQDVIDAPEHHVAQIVDGELFVHPRPAQPHAEVTSVLGMLIGTPFRLGRGGPGGWIIQYEPELHLGADVLVPDLAGWRRTDHPDHDLSAAYVSAAPTWVCEVLSPSTQRLDRVRKLPVYAEAEVAFAWIVHPTDKTLEVFMLERGRWTLAQTHEGEAVVEAPPFEAVALDLGELWPLPPAPSADPNS